MVKKSEKKIIEDISKLVAEITLGDTEVPKKSKAKKWPKVVKGTHLTVYTNEDGSTKLEWDDEALLSEVRNAILKYESNIPASTTKKRKTKEKQ